MTPNVVSPQEVAERRKTGQPVDLLDVRTPAEFREVHAVGARLVPITELDARAVIESRNGSAQEPLYVICRSGSRARQAVEKFVTAGYDNALIVEGGTDAWVAAGLPVVRGATTISLERQVRIVAGSLVLLGSALGFVVHPYFLALPAFVGAGLVFAGITDTCGMGMLLARMPWNNVKLDDRSPAPACARPDTDQANASCCR